MNEAGEDWYDAHLQVVPLVSLPADDAPHDDYVEWWYYNGHVNDAQGRRYSFHYVVFLINALTTHTVAHASLVDHAARQHHTSQRRTAGNPSSGTVDSFDFVLGDWSLTGGGGTDRLDFALDGHRFTLDLQETAAPVMQGGNGILDFEDTGASYYYTRPRMAVTGTLDVDGETRPISGLAWFDHQWGDFEIFRLAWDWFALQLDDGRDIMLYRLFDPRTGRDVLTSGTLSDANGAVELHQRDFQLQVLDHWQSPSTDRRYPIAWRIDIPAHDLSMTVEPIMRGAEFDARTTTYMVYWEGPVQIHGNAPGVGYVELSGYQPAGRRPGAAVLRE